jgi:hypothetical protein
MRFVGLWAAIACLADVHHIAILVFSGDFRVEHVANL